MLHQSLDETKNQASQLLSESVHLKKCIRETAQTGALPVYCPAYALYFLLKHRNDVKVMITHIRPRFQINIEEIKKFLDQVRAIPLKNLEKILIPYNIGLSSNNLAHAITLVVDRKENHIISLDSETVDTSDYQPYR